MIELKSLTKKYGSFTAVDSIDLSVPDGELFGFLGPNGAGKTTTIRMIMNVITPDAGRIELFGGQPASRSLAGRVGFLPEERGLYKKMRVLDHLVFFGEIKGLTPRVARTRSREWLERLGLQDWTAHKIEDLSKGMQQKVQFISALLHEPDLLVLDEPFSGLDPVNSQVMKDVVVDLARQGRTVLFSTHIMEQAERMCDRIVIIARGRKIVDGRIGDVKRDFGGSYVALSFGHDAGRAASVLGDRALVSQIDDYGASAEVRLADGAQADHLLSRLVAAGVGLTRFEVVEPSLNSIFIAKVGPEAATAPAEEVTRG